MNTLSKNNNNDTDLVLSAAVPSTDIERICGGVRALRDFSMLATGPTTISIHITPSVVCIHCLQL